MAHPGGRPTLLRDDRAARLGAELDAAATLEYAAAAAGINPRTLRSWRQRAWSQRPEDAPFVRFEQRVRLALGQASVGTSEPEPESWQTIAARLAADNPAQWGSLDDLYAEDDDWLS